MNSTALAIIQPDELDVIQRTGRMLAASGYFDAKGESAQAIAMMATKILAGREIGIGPFAAVNGIHIIKGKPSIGANLLAATVKGSGRYDYRVRELTDKVCKIEFFQRIGDKLESLGVSEFTAEDAKRAETQNMHKFPRNMLFARAISNGVRWYCPDVFNGNAVYVPEELGAEVDGEGNVIEVTGRIVEPATGEILEPAPNGNGHDNPFENGTPYYVAAWQKLTGKHYDLVNWIQQLHRKGQPCSQDQYGLVVGIVDDLTNKEHNYTLSVLCQSEISKTNLPSKQAASGLLRVLQKEIKGEDGSKIPNPQYRADMAAMVTDIAASMEPLANVTELEF